MRAFKNVDFEDEFTHTKILMEGGDESKGDDKPSRPASMGYFELTFMVFQFVLIYLYSAYCKFDDALHPDPKKNLLKQMPNNRYSCFQDVHVMIFIGFGFLMTFIHSMQWTTLSFNWLISIWALQIVILTNGLMKCWFKEKKWGKEEINLDALIEGDFGAGAAMISFGALLGKCNLQQLMFLIAWEMVFYSYNAKFVTVSMNGSDTGGSMVVHVFGAYYGLAASFFFQPTRAAKSKNLKGGYSANTMAMVGTIFLWMYWPSFNGALTEGPQQQRIFCNTVLSIASSCLSAAFTSRLFFGKLEMEIMLNATLAGGVSIGTNCDLVNDPSIALTIGCLAGILSSVGFQRIGPFLSEKLNLQDTCGVHSLHGMPGVFGALCSCLVIPFMSSNGYPTSYFKKNSFDQQVWAQLFSLGGTLFYAIVSGLIGGKIASLDFFNPVHALFRDDDHMFECVVAYPKSFLVDGDEQFNHVNRLIINLRSHIEAKIQEDAGFDSSEMLDIVWENSMGAKEEVVSKDNANKFFDALAQEDGSKAQFDDSAYQQMWGWVDSENTGEVSKEHMIGFWGAMLQDTI